MDWVDYRELLGIGFNDYEKFNKVKANTINFLNFFYEHYNIQSYVNFSDYTGLPIINTPRLELQHIIRILSETQSLKDFLSYYIAFINTYENEKFNREFLFQKIEKALNQFHIPFDFIEDENEYFIFPKGAKELDNALVSDVLIWLKEYPKTRKTFVIALKQYSEGKYIRDVADNLRKAFEDFLKEFFGVNRNLSNYKTEIGNFLKSNNAENEIVNMVNFLIGNYDKLNNEIAKHNDKVDEKFLEFLLYQTGLFIRMFISVKKSELTDGE